MNRVSEDAMYCNNKMIAVNALSTLLDEQKQTFSLHE